MMMIKRKRRMSKRKNSKMMMRNKRAKMMNWMSILFWQCFQELRRYLSNSRNLYKKFQIKSRPSKSFNLLIILQLTSSSMKDYQIYLLSLLIVPTKCLKATCSNLRRPIKVNIDHCFQAIYSTSARYNLKDLKTLKS